MGWRIVAGVGLLVWPLVPAKADDEAVRLAARTEWVVDYADERCSLHRGFGEGDASVNLRIDWYGPRPGHRIMLVGPGVPKFGTAWNDLGFRLTPDAELRPAGGINGTFLDQPAVSFGATFLPYDPAHDFERMTVAEQMEFAAVPRPPEPEFERQVRSLEVRFANGDAILLALGSMARPLEALRACMTNLQSVWGLDPAEQDTLSRNAVPKPSTVRRVQRYYPSAMASRGLNAFVPVRVMVDAQGKVTECVVQSEGIDEVFADAVCGGLARGYEPALDAGGRPVASVYPTSVFYILQ
jgi:hypothetical protein